METSLHRSLKSLYAGESSPTEVTLGRFRIDVVNGDELIEIQHGSLTAIRAKVIALVKTYRLRVVKPIVLRKMLVKRAARGSRVVDRRLSPKQGSIVDLFRELVYFCRVFPHNNLTLEVPLVNIEEWRYPGHGRRRWRRDRDHLVEDQKLLSIEDVHIFRTPEDLMTILPDGLPRPFCSQQLAERMGIDVGLARQVSYSLRQIGAIRFAGKRRNTLLYVAAM